MALCFNITVSLNSADFLYQNNENRYICKIYFFLRYASIDRAARFPAPIARITVAAPVAISPPAKSPEIEVFPSSSVLIFHCLRY